MQRLHACLRTLEAIQEDDNIGLSNCEHANSPQLNIVQGCPDPGVKRICMQGFNALE